MHGSENAEAQPKIVILLTLAVAHESTAVHVSNFGI